jgi:predicted XRE-type DNA-binding protein
MSEHYESVWDAIEDTPGDAENMKVRSDLMIFLTELIRSRRLTQKAAAKLFGVTQPRISDLMRGKINLFAIDGLINMLATAGMRIEVCVTKRRRPSSSKPAARRSAKLPAVA